MGAVGIAFAPIFVRWSALPPTSTAFYRLALALPLLWAWALTQKRERFRPRLLIPGLCFAADLGVWHWSIRYTTVANSTLLANLAPVFVTLGGWLVFGRRFRRLFLGGMMLAIAGAAVLVGASFRLDSRHVLGDGLGVLTAVFYGSYLLSVGWLREEYSTATIMAWAATAAAILLFPVSWAAGERLWPVGFAEWRVLLGLALVSQVFGQGLIAYALAHLPAAFSSVTLLLQPGLVVVLGWYFFHERFAGWQAAGGVVVIAGILVARRGSRPANAAPDVFE